MFVHGTRDAFASTEELEGARRKIPARTAVEPIAGARHGLAVEAARCGAERFVTFTRG